MQFVFPLFFFISLCPIHSNGKKAIYFKVLWSIFEENGDLYNVTPEHRFQLILHGLVDDEGNDIVPRWFITDRFDIRGYDIGNDVHRMDVEIKVNEEMGKQVESRQFKYEYNQIFILPFHGIYSLPIETVPYDKSIFSKPVRHLHFVVLGSITPLSIECVEMESSKLKKIWSHNFDGNSHLDIQEAVCQYDKYKFTYKRRENQHTKEIVCAEPIYELGFVNRFDVVYEERTKNLTCNHNREDGIQRSGQMEFPISSYSAGEAMRRAQFLGEYKEKIEKILANYEELKRKGKIRADEGTSMNNPELPKDFMEGVFKLYSEQFRVGQGQQQQGIVIGRQAAAEQPQAQQEVRVEAGRHEIGEQPGHIQMQNPVDEEDEDESIGSTGLFEAQQRNALAAEKGKEVIDLTADTPMKEEYNVQQRETLTENLQEQNMQIERLEEGQEHVHGHEAGGSGHQQAEMTHGNEVVTATLEGPPKLGRSRQIEEQEQQVQPVHAGDGQAHRVALENALRELRRNLSLPMSRSSQEEPSPGASPRSENDNLLEEADLAAVEVEQPIGLPQGITGSRASERAQPGSLQLPEHCLLHQMQTNMTSNLSRAQQNQAVNQPSGRTASAPVAEHPPQTMPPQSVEMQRQSSLNPHANVMIGRSPQVDPLSEIFLQTSGQAVQNQSYRPNVGIVQPVMPRMHSGQIISHHGASQNHPRHPGGVHPPLRGIPESSSIPNLRPSYPQVQGVRPQIGSQLQRQEIQGVPAVNIAGIRPTGMDLIRLQYANLLTRQSTASGSTPSERRQPIIGQKRPIETEQNMANIRPRTHLSAGTVPSSSRAEQEARRTPGHIIVGKPVFYNRGRSDEQMPHIAQQSTPVSVQQPGVEPVIHSHQRQHRIELSQRQNPLIGAVQRPNHPHGVVIRGNSATGAVQRPHISRQQPGAAQKPHSAQQPVGAIQRPVSSQQHIKAVQQHSAKVLRDPTPEGSSLPAANRPLFLPRQVSFNSLKSPVVTSKDDQFAEQFALIQQQLAKEKAKLGESSGATEAERRSPGINELPPLQKARQMIATTIRLKEFEEREAEKCLKDEAKKKIILEKIRKLDEQIEEWKEKERKEME